MEQDSFRKAQALLELLYAAGDHKGLRRYAEAKSIDPKISAAATGLLMRSWLPSGAARRVLMLLTTALILALAIEWGRYLPLVFVIVPASFSPRLISEVLTAVGKSSGG